MGKLSTCLSSFNETIDRFRNDIEDRKKSMLLSTSKGGRNWRDVLCEI